MEVGRGVEREEIDGVVGVGYSWEGRRGRKEVESVRVMNTYLLPYMCAGARYDGGVKRVPALSTYLPCYFPYVVVGLAFSLCVF